MGARVSDVTDLPEHGVQVVFVELANSHRIAGMSAL